jgi:RNA recognition motif-containing protein
MSKKLYVASLPYSIGNKELETMFGEIGTVVSAKIILNPATGQGKGFGFVEMSSDEEAQKAIAQLNGAAHGGRNIVVTEAKSEGTREKSHRVKVGKPSKPQWRNNEK